jgi:threonyl-tRNA synthetase
MVFWHPRGAVLYRVLERYIHRRMLRAGFHEVRTPQLLARALWERSGHVEKFGNNMFTIDDGERALALKLDFVMPERLDAAYIDAKSQRIRPVMIHHAVLGSLERFAAILLEHHGGQLPLWLAPEQVVVAPVAGPQIEYARRVAAALESGDLRVVLDERPERLPRRIVHARERGIPVFVAVGNREERDGTVTARRRSGDPVTMPLADLVRQLRSEAEM